MGSELIRSGDIYSCGEHFALPITDSPLGQDLLASIYLRFKAEGVLQIFFHEGLPDLALFLSLMFKPRALTMASFRKSAEGPHKDTVVGIGHVSAPLGIGNGHTKSEVSMAFFKEFQKASITIPCAHLMLQYAFERNAELEALFGCTPERNKAAVRYIQAVGFDRTRDVVKNYTTYEGEPCGCYISWMTLGMWKAKSPFAWQ